MAVSGGATSAYTFTPRSSGVVNITATTRLRSECDKPDVAADKVMRGEVATVAGDDASALRVLLATAGKAAKAARPGGNDEDDEDFTYDPPKTVSIDRTHRDWLEWRNEALSIDLRAALVLLRTVLDGMTVNELAALSDAIEEMEERWGIRAAAVRDE